MNISLWIQSWDKKYIHVSWNFRHFKSDQKCMKGRIFPIGTLWPFSRFPFPPLFLRFPFLYPYIRPGKSLAYPPRTVQTLTATFSGFRQQLANVPPLLFMTAARGIMIPVNISEIVENRRRGEKTEDKHLEKWFLGRTHRIVRSFWVPSIS